MPPCNNVGYLVASQRHYRHTDRAVQPEAHRPKFSKGRLPPDNHHSSTAAPVVVSVTGVGFRVSTAEPLYMVLQLEFVVQDLNPNFAGATCGTCFLLGQLPRISQAVCQVARAFVADCKVCLLHLLIP